MDQGRHFLSLLLFTATLGFHFLPTQSISEDEVFALGAFKKTVYKDPFSVFAGWDKNRNNDPCKWTGVSCSADGDHVVALKLRNLSLQGSIPPEIGSLSYLQELNLSQNMLLGVIPKQIGMLKRLLILDLSDNRLYGSIPSEIGGLTSISIINFHYNGLTGVLPPEINNLMSLVELHLDRNKLRGSIPGGNRFSSHRNATGFCSVKLKVGDFSYNFFNGTIPRCLDYLPRSSFQGNCLHDKNAIIQRSNHLCGGSVHTHGNKIHGSENANAETPIKKQNHQQPKWLLFVEIIAGAMLITFLVIVITMARSKFEPKTSVMNPWKKAIYERNKMLIFTEEGEMLKHVRRFSRQELEAACEDFSNIIGSSSESMVFKGTTKDGNEIAVVSFCMSGDDWNCSHQLYFQAEVANLARVNHENLAKLVGYCDEVVPFSRMLVFEYASNGTLYEHLHYGEGSQLLWSKRMKIALAIARGLKYLHVDLQPPIALSELQSSSIYLNEDFNLKLVDFESWKALFTESAMSSVTANRSIFHGLRDLQWRSDVDIQGNILSFGVLLLEIITGRPPYCKDRGYLVDWAMEYLDKPEKMCHLIDPELRYFNHDDLQAICAAVSLCLQSEPSKSPSMEVILAILENGIDTSAMANLKESPLAWAELALLSP